MMPGTFDFCLLCHVQQYVFDVARFSARLSYLRRFALFLLSIVSIGDYRNQYVRIFIT